MKSQIKRLRLPAAEHVIRHGYATQAMLRDRFQIGQKTAQLLLHELEAQGIVAPSGAHVRRRDVLVPLRDLDAVRRQLGGDT